MTMAEKLINRVAVIWTEDGTDTLFRYVARISELFGGSWIEVRGVDCLGEPTWAPDRSEKWNVAAILSHAIVRMLRTGVDSGYDHPEIETDVIDLGPMKPYT